MLLTRTPQAELGRVMALLSLSVEGVIPISYAATGVLAATFGAPATFPVGGLIILATAGLVDARPSLRSCQHVTTPPEAQPTEPAGSGETSSA